MKTYIIFFGKSQDFNIHIFDENGYVRNIDHVKSDFDLLESRYFTIDDFRNKEILSKYYFKGKLNKSYSLLKLYSFGQANSGSRIEGSIYGVAILSELDVIISEINNKILSELKRKFAESSLVGSKFIITNFKNEVSYIWQIFKDKNYFQKISLTNITSNYQDTYPRGYYVNNLYQDSIEIGRETINCTNVYFSEDLEHLKRTYTKWSPMFVVYYQVNNKYIPYQMPDQNIDNSKIEFNELRIELGNLIKKNESLTKTFKIYRKKTRIIFSILLLSCIITNLIIYNTINKKKIDKIKNTPKKESSLDPINNQLKTSSFISEDYISNIFFIKTEVTNKLITNIKNYNTQDKSNTLINAILRDAKTLNLDTIALFKIINKK